MEDLKQIFSPSSLQLVKSLQELATELDKGLSFHLLVRVNEEGFMEKNPTYSEFLQQWVADYGRRKEHYAAEELLSWLKTEREKELEKMKQYREEGKKNYFEKLLEIIQAEIREQGERKSGKLDKGDLMDLIRDDRLKEVMEKLEQLFSSQEMYDDQAMDLIMHQGRLAELERLYTQNRMEEEDYLQEKAELRRALILILKDL